MGNSVKNPFKSCGKDTDDVEPVADAGPDLPQAPESRRSKRAKKSGSGKSGAKAQGPAGTGDMSHLPPFSLEEAVDLQMELRAAFADKSFQQLMSRIKERYPQHAKEGHQDNTMFTADLQKLMLNVYNRVLPKPPWSLEPGPLGARQMHARMATIVDHPSVRAIQEQIGDLLRGNVFGGSLEEPLLELSHNGSGMIDEYHIPLLQDPDGDLAHEFLVMDGRCRLRRADARSHPPELLIPSNRPKSPSRPAADRDKAKSTSNVVV